MENISDFFFVSEHVYVMAQIVILKCIHILYLSTKHKQRYLG